MFFTLNPQEPRSRPSRIQTGDSTLAYLQDAQWVERPSRLFGRLLAGIDLAALPPAAAVAQQFQIPILKRIARGEGHRAVAAQRVLETIFVQFNFYLQRQVSGPKLDITRAVARIIHPD